MKTHRNTLRQGSTLVVTISVVATILTFLGIAVQFTQQIARVSNRSRQSALAMEVADGHLEYLFTNWRNIYRGTWTSYNTSSGGTDYSLVGTNYFFTSMYNPGPAPTPVTNMSPAATPAPIPTPASSNFPDVPNYTLTQYRIQAVDPMIDLDVSKSFGNDPERALRETSFGSGNYQLLPNDAIPYAAYGPNTWQYSFFYLAAADVTLPAFGGSGTVTAKVRRVFEKKFDNPWTYAMFYNDDLEFQPSTAFSLDGPVQSNNNLYIGTSNFTALDKVTYSGDFVNGYSPNDTSSHAGGISTPNFPATLPPAQTAPSLPFGWNLNFNTNNSGLNDDSYHEIIERPASGTDPLANVRLYNQADIRVLIDSSNNFTVYDINGTQCLSNSGGRLKKIYDTVNNALSRNIAFQDQREGTYIRVANVDIGKITADINANKISNFGGVIYFSDTSTNGTTISAPLGGGGGPSVSTTERGIRLVNGTGLPNNGLTIVAENPVYIQGNYNTGGNNPPSNSGTYTSPTSGTYGILNTDDGKYHGYSAAIIGDSINILSTGWSDVNSTGNISTRTASANLTINAALVGGNVPSGGGYYSGGGENFLRFLEDWSSKTLCYYGSMVQLYQSKQGVGHWTGTGVTYMAPLTSKWFYDTNFGNTAPPGNMQIAAYLQQQRWYQVY